MRSDVVANRPLQTALATALQLGFPGIADFWRRALFDPREAGLMRRDALCADSFRRPRKAARSNPRGSSRDNCAQRDARAGLTDVPRPVALSDCFRIIAPISIWQFARQRVGHQLHFVSKGSPLFYSHGFPSCA